MDPDCSTPVRLSQADWNVWCRVLGRTKQRRNSRHLQGVPVSPGFLLSCMCSGHDTVGLGRNQPRTVSYADCRGLSAQRGGALTRHSRNITEHPGQSICNSSPRSPEQGPPKRDQTKLKRHLKGSCQPSMRLAAFQNKNEHSLHQDNKFQIPKMMCPKCPIYNPKLLDILRRKRPG